MTIYSKQLFLGSVPSSWDVIFEAQPDITTVIRDIELANSGTAPALVQVTCNGPDGNATLVNIPVLEAGETFQWQGRAVMAQGDQLFGNAPGGPVYAWISGYELTT